MLLDILIWLRPLLVVFVSDCFTNIMPNLRIADATNFQKLNFSFLLQLLIQTNSHIVL